MLDQHLVGQVIEILLGDGRADPIPLDLALWQAGPRQGSTPTGRSPLRLLRRLLRQLQSRRPLLHHCRRRGWNGAAALSSANAAEESGDEGGENEGALFKNLRPVPYMESLPSG